jgi:hypothetical protein
MITETKIEFGRAARKNRGSYSGQKTHRLVSTYIVGLAEGYEVRPGTYAAEFQREGRPVLVSCHPACSCTQGQHAGRPVAGLTEKDVNCTKCGR